VVGVGVLRHFRGDVYFWLLARVMSVDSTVLGGAVSATTPQENHIQSCCDVLRTAQALCCQLRRYGGRRAPDDHPARGLYPPVLMNTPVSPAGEAARPHVSHRGVSRAEFLNLFFAVFLPMFMAAVDQTLLATATPSIAGSLGNLRDSSWIASAYLLASAVIVPMYGRLGDLRGKRTMLLVALGVFAVGSLACSLAQTMPQLVAARVLQGLGGGGLMTLSQALIGELVPPIERVRFQGYFALMFTTASIGGPVLGGLVVSNFSWRWLFVANLPLAAFAAWRLTRLPPGERHPQTDGGSDVPGHLLFAVGAVSALLWLTSGGHRFAWTSSISLAIAASAVLCLALLSWHERRHPSPFLPVDLLRDATIRLSAVLVMLFAACMFALIFFLPIYLQLGHRVSAQLSGLLLLPVTAGQVAASIAASQVLRRTGDPHLIPVVGMSLTSGGLLLLGLLPPHIGLVIAVGFMTGLGLGTVMPVTQVVVQTVGGRTKLGAATATLSLARSTGGAAGAALFGALVFAMIPDVDRHTVVQNASALEVETVVRAFHRAFLIAALVAAFAAFTARRIPRIRLWQPSRQQAGSTASK
jgi:EmrB/QacA subfamily drug resistance transporter